MREVLTRIEISDGHVRIQLDKVAIKSLLLGRSYVDSPHQPPISLNCPLEIRRRGSEVRLILAEEGFEQERATPTLIRAIGRARHWTDLIVSGEISTVRQLVEQSGLDRHSVTLQLRCAALSPQLIGCVLAGKQPLALTVAQMSKSIQLDWTLQSVSDA